MNATPMIPTAAATHALQGSASRKGDPAAPDTSFAQLLSAGMALQSPADSRASDDLAQRLKTLLDRAEDAEMATDPALALQAAADSSQQVPAAETLLGLGLSFTPPAQATPAVTGKASSDSALDIDADVRRDLPTMPETTGKPALAVPGTDGSAMDGEPAPALLAARLSEGMQTTESPNAPINAAALRPAPTPSAADTGAAPAVPSSRLAPEVGTAAWSQALGEKVVWMATGTQQSATLTLNPPNLGPLQVVIDVSHDQASANFFAAQPEVRQAIEAALPRLREMMGEAGIQLGQANVSADTPSRHSASEQQPTRTSSPAGASAEPEQPVATSAIRVGRGLVDTFA